MNIELICAIIVTALILFAVFGLIGAALEKLWMLLVGLLPICLIGIIALIFAFIDLWKRALS
jgi:sterol desaturase/sphingolipid hydroxylase (fatty acid hydroxylase superfamily)